MGTAYYRISLIKVFSSTCTCPKTTGTTDNRIFNSKWSMEQSSKCQQLY